MIALAIVMGIAVVTTGADVVAAPQKDRCLQNNGWRFIEAPAWGSNEGSDPIRYDVVVGKDPDDLFVKGPQSVFRAVDGCSGWKLLLSTNIVDYQDRYLDEWATIVPPGSSFDGMEVSPDGKTIYVGLETRKVLGIGEVPLVAASSDGGRTWSSTPLAAPGSVPAVSAGRHWQLKAAPGDPKRVYSLSAHPCPDVDDANAESGYGVRRGLCLMVSRDAGQTWEIVDKDKVYAEHLERAGNDTPVKLLVDPIDPDGLWLNSWGRILHSKDAGKTWSVVKVDVAAPGVSTAGEFFIATSHKGKLHLAGLMFDEPKPGDEPSNPNRPAILRSSDGGRTWTKEAFRGVQNKPNKPLKRFPQTAGHGWQLVDFQLGRTPDCSYALGWEIYKLEKQDPGGTGLETEMVSLVYRSSQPGIWTKWRKLPPTLMHASNFIYSEAGQVITLWSETNSHIAQTIERQPSEGGRRSPC